MLNRVQVDIFKKASLSRNFELNVFHYVQNKIRKVLLRKNGWNVDVPLTSHYRQGPKRKSKKKHLTGNSYYAAMGKKGGRPKLYG